MERNNTQSILYRHLNTHWFAVTSEFRQSKKLNLSIGTKLDEDLWHVC